MRSCPPPPPLRSTWLLAFTLIIAPLWFNPFTFDMEKVQKNFIAWKQVRRVEVRRSVEACAWK